MKAAKMGVSHKPYPGLDAYSEDDHSYFFGRDKETRTIAFNLMGAKLTLLYGPAGVGKTSVLRAGVSFDVHQLALENIENGRPPEFVPVVFSWWRDDPAKSLCKAIGDAAVALRPNHQSKLHEPNLVKTIEYWSERLESDILIILDQFEYYFLHYKPDDSAAFAKELADAVNNKALRANFLISIREDALSKLDVFKGKIPRLFDNYLRIEHLRTKAAHDAIKEPITVYNKEFSADAPFKIEDRLIDEVINQVEVGQVTTGENGHEMIGLESEPAAGDALIEAPLLQMVMAELWKKESQQNSHLLRLTTLTKLGNTEGIVRSNLDGEMKSLTDDETRVAAKIFYHLVTPSGLKIALSVKDLSGYTREPENVLLQVLRRLETARILREARPTLAGSARFEIFHEVMAPAVLGWISRYKIEKDTQRERTEFERKSRRARRIVIIAAVVSLAFVAISVYAVIQARRAKVAGRLADEQKERYENEVFSRAQQVAELPFFRALLRGHAGGVNKAVFSPDGSLVATVSDDGTARLWRSADGTEQRTLRLTKPVTDVAFNFDGTLVAIASSNLVTLWNPNTGTYDSLKGHVVEVRRVAFSPTNRELLASSDDVGVVMIWNINQKADVRRLRGHTGRVNDVEWSTQGPMLITAGKDSTARVWDLSAGTSIQLRHDGPIHAAVFSPDGKEILTASEDWFAKLWNAKTGELIRVLKGHRGPIYFAEFAKDNKTMVTASGDRTVRLWNMKNRELIAELNGYSDEVNGARYSNDGTKIVTWGKDRTSRVWDNSGKLLYELRAHIKPVRSADFSSDGRLAVTASEDHTVMVWKVGATRATVTETKVSVEPDYSGRCPNTIRVFGRISVEGASGTVKYRFVLSGHPWPERSLVFEAPGTKTIGAIFKVPSSGSVYLQVTAPENSKSPSVRFPVRCESTPPEEKKEAPQPSPKTIDR